MSDRDPGNEVRDYPDQVLLAGFAARHPQLALNFVRRFQNGIYGVAYTIVRDTALAEDIAQQAFEHAWLRAATYDPERGSVRGWLLRITRNLAIDAVRVHRPTPLDGEHLEALVGHMMRTPEQEVLDAEESVAALVSLRGALAALPMEQARAVILAVGHGLSAQQIAEKENLPLGTAKYRIRAGLRKLQRARSAPGRGPGGTALTPGDHDGAERMDTSAPGCT
jgi:RNA polymerase sigma-70 factor (ECF subfamily)